MMRTDTVAVGALLATLMYVAACGGGEEQATPPVAAPPPTAAATENATPPPAEPPPAQPSAANDRAFPPAQLDAMVAPIALYPDALLMQVLMASTYPTEIVMADRWRSDHPDLEGDGLDQALTEQAWDPSVSSLTFFPDVLHRMSENLEWTTDLGDAFLSQQDDVMDACQRLRVQASQAGTLKTTKEQTVIVEKEVVKIEPANPEVIYVPQYNTTTVYGSGYQPAPQYYPAVQTGHSDATLATASLLSFGVGMLAGYAIWGGCDWNNHHVYYGGYHGGGGGPKYVNKVKINGDVNINVGGNRGRPNWAHNPEHRRGVAYKQPTTRDRYAGNDPRRNRFDDDRTRGRDANLGGGSRPGSRPGDRTGDRAGNRPGQAGSDRAKMPARPKAGTANKPAPKKPTQMAKPTPTRKAAPAARKPAAGKTAFGGSRDASAQRQASQRGAESRGRSAGTSAQRSGGQGMGGGGGGGGGKRRGGGGGKKR